MEEAWGRIQRRFGGLGRSRAESIGQDSEAHFVDFVRWKSSWKSWASCSLVQNKPGDKLHFPCWLASHQERIPIRRSPEGSPLSSASETMGNLRSVLRMCAASVQCGKCKFALGLTRRAPDQWCNANERGTRG